MRQSQDVVIGLCTKDFLFLLLQYFGPFSSHDLPDCVNYVQTQITDLHKKISHNCNLSAQQLVDPTKVADVYSFAQFLSYVWLATQTIWSSYFPSKQKHKLATINYTVVSVRLLVLKGKVCYYKKIFLCKNLTSVHNIFNFYV